MATIAVPIRISKREQLEARIKTIERRLEEIESERGDLDMEEMTLEEEQDRLDEELMKLDFRDEEDEEIEAEITITPQMERLVREARGKSWDEMRTLNAQYQAEAMRQIRPEGVMNW